MRASRKTILLHGWESAVYCGIAGAGWRTVQTIFQISGVCEPDEAVRAEFGGHENYAGLPWITEEELLNREDIDAVLCEGHELRSVSDAQKCLDHGLHVHLDKPGGADLAAFRKLFDTARAKNLTLHIWLLK